MSQVQSPSAPNESGPAKKAWTAPKLRQLKAGSAENAVTPRSDNGVNFS